MKRALLGLIIAICFLFGVATGWADTTGTLYVSVTPETASWSLDGPGSADYEDTGTSTVAGVVAGTYELTWSALTHYTLPDPATSTTILTGGSSHTWTGTYTRHTGTVNIEVRPVKDGHTAAWILTQGDSSTTTASGDAVVTGVKTGSVSVNWGALSGYTAPDPDPATAQNLAQNGTVTFAGVYTPISSGTCTVTVFRAAADADVQSRRAMALAVAPPGDLGTNLRCAEFDWAADSDGDMVATTALVSGVLAYVVVYPDAGATSPTAAYDLTLKDELGRDVLGGVGSNLAASGTSGTALTQPTLRNLTLTSDNAGDSNGGTVWLFYQP